MILSILDESCLREMIALYLHAQSAHQALKAQLFGLLKNVLESLDNACQSYYQSGIILIILA